VIPRCLVLPGVLVGILTLVPSAHGFVYWANNNTIGRANLAGGGVNQNFMTVAAGSGLAVDSGHLYWSGSGAIGRADIDGSSPNPGFITAPSSPQGVAVDGGHVYWADFATTTIGRADIDGGGTPEPSFIAGDNQLRGVAVDSSHVYWTNLESNSSIGRADIDGSNPNNGFMGDAFLPVAVAVDATHIYWANQGTNSIARAGLDGSGSNQTFITGASNPEGVAVDGTHVYWANQGAGTIGRAPLSNPNGPGKDQSFITGAVSPRGIAVDGVSVPSCRAASASTGYGEPVALTLPCTSGGGKRTFSIASQPGHGEISGLNASTGRLTYTPDTGFNGTDSFRFRVRNPGATSNAATATVQVAQASNEFVLGGVDRNKRKGTAELAVEVPGAGDLELGGAKVKPATAAADGAGEVTLPVKARGKGRKKLKKKGKAKVAAEVTFAPVGGEPSTQSKSVKLVKR
jgi:hypothetical protein